MPATKAQTPPIRRGFPFSEFKTLNDGAGTFEGYMSVFGIEDSGGDIVEPGAFTKTLTDLKAKQRARQGVPSGRYLLPIFWNHDPNQCIGGIVDAYEDSHGVYVKGELDLSVEQARNAYSGLKAGYIPGMSFGYFALKYQYDRLGIRHLKELSVFESTITPIPMHDMALVAEVKSACGDPGLPLADRGRAWDGAGAHNRVVAWATDSDGNVDAAKMKQAHFWYDESAPDKITSYKLGFADLIDGKLTAIPRGVFAVAAVLSGSRGGANLNGDTDAVKAKVAAYYKRMAKEFDDDSMTAPWEAKSGKALDFNAAYAAISADDSLQDEWGDTFQALVTSLYSVMCEGNLPGDSGAQDAADTVLQQFSARMSDLVKRSLQAQFTPTLDDDGDSFYDPDGPNATEMPTSMPMMGYDSSDYMSRDTSTAEGKAGRMMSAANHSELGGMISDMGKSLKAMTASHKALQAYHAKMDPSSTKPDANGGDTTSGDTDASSGGKDGKAMQPPTDTGAGRHGDDTTPTEEPLTVEEVRSLIREKMQAQALAQRVGAQQTA